MDSKTVKNENGVYVEFCTVCNNQLNHLDYGGYAYCKSKKFDCNKCDSPCTGLNGVTETGYESRTVTGYCKKCNTKISYGG